MIHITWNGTKNHSDLELSPLAVELRIGFPVSQRLGEGLWLATVTAKKQRKTPQE